MVSGRSVTSRMVTAGVRKMQPLPGRYRCPSARKTPPSSRRTKSKRPSGSKNRTPASPLNAERIHPRGCADGASTRRAFRGTAYRRPAPRRGRAGGRARPRSRRGAWSRGRSFPAQGPGLGEDGARRRSSGWNSSSTSLIGLPVTKMRCAGDALAQQVRPAALGVRHQHVAGVVDDAAVDLFGHAVVVAAVAGLHVIDGNAHAAWR